MDLVQLTDFLVKQVVKEPDLVSVKQFEDENQILIQVLVSKEDMGLVIGKGGNVINSIRTLVQAVAYAHNLYRVRINIDSF
jgi:predicted RNA-binding protein YlqC (UPF0109 family)